MAFVRVRGNSHTLIEAYRVGDKVRQRIVANLGPYPSVKAAVRAEPEKFRHLVEPAAPLVSPLVMRVTRLLQAADLDRDAVAKIVRMISEAEEYRDGQKGRSRRPEK